MADREGPAAFTAPGRFWRGGLHSHSDRSDGALSPQEVADRYRAAGYDFLAVTDHFRAVHGYPVTDTRGLRRDGFTTLLGAELHAPGPELATEWHLIAVGLPLDFAPLQPGEDGPLLARRARAAGAWVGIAHPAASLLTLTDADALDAAHAVETYNELATREDRADSWAFYDTLLARGRRLDAYAADDAHFQPGDPPGWSIGRPAPAGFRPPRRPPSTSELAPASRRPRPPLRTPGAAPGAAPIAVPAT